ncbi:hypothetical protein KJ640_05370, partial [bacterium]|nr:hypothetical protein [bacterium]
CYWFSCDVRGVSSISIRDINGLEATYDITSFAKGFDSEMANAKFLWKFGNPYVIWDALCNPTQPVLHSGLTLQDLINELRARGYDLDYLLDELGLRPILGTVTNTDTPNPFFYFDLNNIFSGTTTIRLDISEDYDFGTLTYSGTPSVSFLGTSTGSYRLMEKDLSDSIYFWRIKVLNPDLPNLYSDVGAFEIEETGSCNLIIFPQSGPVGTLITVKGLNFATNTGVSISFGTHLTITSTISSENGTFSVTFMIDTQPFCTKMITATDLEGNEAVDIFLLAPEPKIILLSPTSGVVGRLVTIEGKDFSPNATVNIGFGTNPVITTTISSINGTFSTQFYIDTQPTGATIIIVSANSYIGQVYAVTTFLLTPPSLTIYWVDAGNTSGIEYGTPEFPYNTIQKGIDACPSYGTVCVRDGTYTGAGNKNLSWIGKHITLRSENGPTGCIIDCQNSGRGFSFNNTGQNSSDLIQGFTIRNGSGDGGGIYCYSSSPSILNCTISENTAGYGGGISCYYSSPSITNCTISGNTASSSGGGIRCFYSSPSIINCIISGNTTNYDGGGISCILSSPAILNCTISNNSATGRGGGIYCSSSSPSILNNIIVSNNPYGIYKYSGSPSIDYNNLFSNTPGNYYNCSTGTHGISVNPQFIGGGDFHLGSTSPCIDKGTNTPPGGLPLTDKDGNPRIIDGNNDGTVTVDMGAYEYQGTPTIYPQIQVSPTSGYVGTTITVQGSGFMVQGSVTIDFGTHQTITTTITSSNGTFSATFIVDTQPYGTTIITLTAYSLQLTTSFFITESIDPASLYSEGNVGDEIIFSGSGWPGNKGIAIHFGTHLTIAATTTSSNGTFSVTFIASTQPYGTTIITAEGCMATGIYFIKPKIVFLYPPSGVLGTEVIVEGSGMRDEGLVRVDFGTHLNITTTTSSLNGTFRACFYVDDQEPSTKTITASQDAEIYGTTTFLILEMPTNLPDLIITKINISPNRPIFEGDRINVVAWVKNIGDALAEDIEVRFLDGTETQGTRTINRLSPGQTQARQMNWRIYPPGHSPCLGLSWS